MTTFSASKTASGVQTPILLSVVVLSTCLTGCYSWSHAPGWKDSKAAMTKVEIPVVTGQLCTNGFCTLEGPEGPIRFSSKGIRGFNKLREETRFVATYHNITSTCIGPTQSASGHDLAFACSLASAGNEIATVELLPGCVFGTLSQWGPGGACAFRPWNIQSDEVKVLGHRTPGIELSLVDSEGVVAFSSRYGMGSIEMWMRPRTKLSPAEIAALSSLHAFFEIEGTPAKCLVPDNGAKAALK